MKLISRNFSPVTYSNSLLDPFLIKDIFQASFDSKERAFNNVPAFNIKQGKESYSIEMAVPGYTKNDFSIEVDKGILTVSAKTKNMSDHEDAYTLRQFSSGTFKKVFRIPENKLKIELLKANYEAGVLTVLLPKKEEVHSKLTIEVS